VLNRASPGSTGSGTDFFHLWRPVTLVATTASDLFGGSKWSPTPTSARQVKLQFSGSGHLLSEIILRQGSSLSRGDRFRRELDLM
jgi:hypothetical protein